MQYQETHGKSYAVNSICRLCSKPIDLHHTIVPLVDTYVHYNCAVFSKYDKLINIAGSLVEAIEQGEDIDLDELREDLLLALAAIDGN